MIIRLSENATKAHPIPTFCHKENFASTVSNMHILEINFSYESPTKVGDEITSSTYRDHVTNICVSKLVHHW